MSLLDFFKNMDSGSMTAWVISILIILPTFIQISPIKLDPWSKLFKFIGNALTQPISEKIDSELTEKIGEVTTSLGDVDSKLDDIDDRMCNLERKVDKLESDALEDREKDLEREAVSRRIRIIRFGDEIIHQTKHSKEHFDQILTDVTWYEQYCKDHPSFQNEIAVMTIHTIKETYKKCMAEQSFL